MSNQASNTMSPQHHSSNRSIGRIALIYRIYFLYLEPLAALGGTYLCFFSPSRFLSGTVPLPIYLSLTSSPNWHISPLLQMLLMNIGSLYLLFAIQEGIILRLTDEKSVWLVVMFSMVCTDLGHLWAVGGMDWARMGMVGSWNGDEWINYGTLFGGLMLRIAFLVGIGRK